MANPWPARHNFPVSWRNLILDLLLPDTCMLCQQEQMQRTAHLLCHFCWASLPRNGCACPHCALPQTRPGVCGGCQSSPLTPGICIAALRHEADARLLVHQLKYNNSLRAATTLGTVLTSAVRSHYATLELPTALIPVPQAYLRQVRRGYNQATWLANQLARQLGRPVLAGSIRRRPGAAQHTLSRNQRLTLSARQFKQVRPIRHDHVAIVDDVLTTGATVAALQQVLHTAGAERVDIWCATRAVLD